MRIGLYSFEKEHGRIDIGSTRIRGKWLVKYWEDAEMYKYGQEYDVIIYQKAYLTEHAKAFNGIKIFDLCDPDFLHWGYRTVEMINECDVVTTSTEELAKSIRNFTDKQVICVPDRHDLEFYKNKKVHKGDAESVVWFGYSTGFTMVDSVMPILKKLGLDLIVIADKPYPIQKAYRDKVDVTSYTWSLETVNDDIIRGDIVINPQSKKGKWKYKSNNKTISAYLLNMPVAKDAKHLEKLIDEKTRAEEAKKSREQAERDYDIKISVDRLKEIIQSVKK